MTPIPREGYRVPMPMAGTWIERLNTDAGWYGGSNKGNQGAVILLVVSVIMGIHALGGLDYHPTAAEADMMRSRAR